MAGLKGKFTLTVANARDLYSTQLIGRQDPFALYHVDMNKHTTKTYKDGGKSAEWNDVGVFMLKGHESTIEIDVFAAGTVSNTLIGHASIPITKVIEAKQGWYPITRNHNEPAGEVEMLGEFVSSEPAPAPKPAAPVAAPKPQPPAPAPAPAPAPVVVAPAPVKVEVKQPPSVMKLPGNAARVAIGNYHNFVAVNVKSGNFFQWQAGNWVQQPGSAVDASIGEDGELWVATADGALFKRTNAGWLAVLNTPGKVAKISVANANHVVVLTQEKAPFLWRQGRWEKLPGQFAEIAVGNDGDLWAIDEQNAIFHFSNNNWMRIGGSATAIGVGKAGVVVCANKYTSKMFSLQGDVWVEVMGAAAHHCDVGPDGVFVACNPQEIFFGRI